jgi:hypothetical protein
MSGTEELLAIIDTSLTVTLSGEFIRLLQRNVDNETLLKITVCCSVILGMIRTTETTVIPICRKFIVVGTVQVLISNMQVGEGYALLLNVCLLVIVTCFVSDISHRFTNQPIPEIDRLSRSVRWIYADTLGAYLRHSSIKGPLTIIGALGIPQLSRLSASSGSTPLQLFVTGISMTWVNLIVQLVLSDRVARGSVVIELVALSVLGMMMRTFQQHFAGFHQMEGYIEWHINTIIISTALDANAGYLDIAIAALALASIIVMLCKLRYTLTDIPSSITSLTNMCYLITTTATSRYAIERINLMGGANDPVFLFIMVVALETAGHIVLLYSKVHDF